MGVLHGGEAQGLGWELRPASAGQFETGGVGARWCWLKIVNFGPGFTIGLVEDRHS